ncbi:MAG: hypothetical protein HZB50_13010 [Chloroflexi bacterium]|nr:hypothetical protein [Chloroflexota bacterium]
MNNKDVMQTGFARYWKDILFKSWQKSWEKWGMLGIIFPAIVSFLYAFITNWGKSLSAIFGEHWILYCFLFIVLYLITVGFFVLKEPVIVYNNDQKTIFGLNEEISEMKSILPNVIPFSCGIDTILTNINQYGANSLLGRYLNTDRRLLYIDFINKPKKQNNNQAIGVSVYLKYYDKDGNKINREHFGRWIEMPETKFEKHIKTNISSDGEAGRKRLGIGYYDIGGNGALTLLDAKTTDLNENGIISGSDIQYLSVGKYFVVASISGENVQNGSPLLFEIEVGNKKVLEFKQNENSGIFFKMIKEVEARSPLLWNS